jgi:hypothetical protein
MNSYPQKNFFQPLATSNFVDFSINSSGKLAPSSPSSMAQRQHDRIQRKPSLPLSSGLILSTILAFLSREFRQYHGGATEDEIGTKLPFDNTISEFDRWNDGVFFERDNVIDMKSDNDLLVDDDQRTWNWGNMFGEWGFIFGEKDIQVSNIVHSFGLSILLLLLLLLSVLNDLKISKTTAEPTFDYCHYKQYDHDDGDSITVSVSEDEYQLHEDYQPARTIIH